MPTAWGYKATKQHNINPTATPWDNKRKDTKQRPVRAT